MPTPSNTPARDFTIDGASMADLSAIVAISRTAPWDKEAFLAREVGRGNVLVAREGDAACGFLAWNREFFSRPFVWLIVVAPALRREGLAGRLFAMVESRCVGERLYTSTNRSNLAMQRFLEGRGYRAAGEFDLDPGDPECFYCLDVPPA